MIKKKHSTLNKLKVSSPVQLLSIASSLHNLTMTLDLA